MEPRGELYADAERVAGSLQASGVGPGNVVAVQLGSTQDMGGAVLRATATEAAISAGGRRRGRQLNDGGRVSRVRR